MICIICWFFAFLYALQFHPSVQKAWNGNSVLSILSDIFILPIIKALGLFSEIFSNINNCKLHSVKWTGPTHGQFFRTGRSLPVFALENKSLGQTIHSVCLSKRILIEGEKDFYVSEFVPYNTNKKLDVRLKYEQSSKKRRAKTQVTLSTKVSISSLTNP